MPTNITAQARAKLIDVENFIKKIEELTKHLREEILVAQAIYKASANNSRRLSPRYLVGDEVWLNIKNLNTARPTAKLDNRQVGPYRVKRVFDRNLLIVELDLPLSIKVYPVFYTYLLSHVA